MRNGDGTWTAVEIKVPYQTGCRICGKTLKPPGLVWILGSGLSADKYCSEDCVLERADKRKYKITRWVDYSHSCYQSGRKTMKTNRIYSVITITKDTDANITKVTKPVLILATSLNDAIVKASIVNPPKKNEEIQVEDTNYRPLSG